MKIEILGAGDSRCRTLEEHARAAAQRLGIDCEVIAIHDPEILRSRQLAFTPALAIDGETHFVGTRCSETQLTAILFEELEARSARRAEFLARQDRKATGPASPGATGRTLSTRLRVRKWIRRAPSPTVQSLLWRRWLTR